MSSRFHAVLLSCLLLFTTTARGGDMELMELIEALRSQGQVKVALIHTNYHEERLKYLIPNAEIVKLESAEQFFVDKSHGADALVLTVEEGSAYAYRYPQYTVIEPPVRIG